MPRRNRNALRAGNYPRSKTKSLGSAYKPVCWDCYYDPFKTCLRHLAAMEQEEGAGEYRAPDHRPGRRPDQVRGMR